MTTKYKLPDGTEVPPLVWHCMEAYGKAMELLDEAGVPVMEDGSGLGLVRRVELLLAERDRDKGWLEWWNDSVS